MDLKPEGKNHLISTICIISFKIGTDLYCKIENDITPLGNYASGSCGLNVLGDHENLVVSCHNLQNKSELDSCAMNITDFLNKYPQIFCGKIEIEESQGESFITESDLVKLKNDYIDTRKYYAE